ncbi:hypothetical protein E2562_026290 [Oryza meyeriana var. granulata]|uniref:Uncharacterized protein n=1 Tax=Oryza meyeriana var. granulata TaxID=110450 RepID=A0A6G1C8Z9_9ORYZ|nr:hypothetical protein E2562_026290 [Oryza meyeriana var. granulata]
MEDMEAGNMAVEVDTTVAMVSIVVDMEVAGLVVGFMDWGNGMTGQLDDALQWWQNGWPIMHQQWLELRFISWWPWLVPTVLWLKCQRRLELWLRLGSSDGKRHGAGVVGSPCGSVGECSGAASGAGVGGHAVAAQVVARGGVVLAVAAVAGHGLWDGTVVSQGQGSREWYPSSIPSIEVLPPSKGATSTSATCVDSVQVATCVAALTINIPPSSTLALHISRREEEGKKQIKAFT